MPIYDYACNACGHLTEVVHGIHDHGPKFCPECGAEGTMTKAFAPPTFHFKGSGWAKKDRSTASRSSSAKKEEDTAKPAGTGTEGGSSSSTSTGSDSGGGSTASGGTTAPAASSGD